MEARAPLEMATLDVTAVTGIRSGAKVKGWLLTILATVVSTYALDGVATAAGMVLVASGVMRGAAQPVLWLVLAATYVAWGAGLRVNLRANYDLLETVGTSSNAFSKVAYELVRKRARTVRTRKVAAAAAYVGTEIVKEVPYYVVAFGVALASDAITSRDALVFLAGTNLGAAVYEYGLGRVTWAYLRRPANRT
jgi:hypothetical protein